MLHTDLVRERELLLRHGILDEVRLAQADENARRAAFVRGTWS